MTLSTVVAVQTAGLPSANEYVKTFRLKYSVDCTIFNEVGNNLVIHYFVRTYINLIICKMNAIRGT